MTKTRRIAAAVLFTFLPLTVVPVHSHAQEDAMTLQARARFKEGVDAYDKGKYEEARLAFLQAYTLKKHPAVLLNLAQSSAKSGHPLDAAKYFQQYLKEATTATPAQKKDAETGLAEVRQKIARIDVVAASGTDITMDGQSVGTTPMDPLDVEPGQHTIKGAGQSVTVTAVVGQKVEANLTKAATPAPVAPTTSPTEATPPPAPSKPEAAADKGPTNKRTSLLSPPESMTPVYVGLGIAGVGLAGAIVFAAFKADAQSKADTLVSDIRSAARRDNRAGPDGRAGTADDATNICSDPGYPQFRDACNKLVENNDKVDANALIANVSLGVLGAGLLFAGIWYLAAPKRDDAKAAPAAPATGFKVTPVLGFKNLGLVGTF